ncbi:hypothetical protein RQP46_003695 [Phenoliferia psychrophenolica]
MASGPSEDQYWSICNDIQSSIELQIDLQTRDDDPFLSLIPADVLRTIIGFTIRDRPSPLDVALLNKSWANITFPLIWRSIAVDFNEVSEVKSFAEVAQKTNLRISILEICVTAPSSFSVDCAVLAVEGLRELTLTEAAVSMSVFENPSMLDLTYLALDLVDLVALSDARHSPILNLPFNLRSLSITRGSLNEDLIDILLTAITTTSSTLESLTLDSPKAVRKHLPTLSQNLVELVLQDCDSEYLSTFEPTTLDFSALRKLSLPFSELPALLIQPHANAPPDAPPRTISQKIPQLESLTILCTKEYVGPDNVSNLSRLLRLPVCKALRTLALVDAESGEGVPLLEMDDFNELVVVCKGRGLEVKVDGERQ